MRRRKRKLKYQNEINEEKISEKNYNKHCNFFLKKINTLNYFRDLISYMLMKLYL